MPHRTSRRSFLAALSAAVAAATVATAARPLLGADVPKKKPHILLKSGWQTVNIGDIGHTPGMLQLLADLLPQADVTLWPNSIKGDGVPEFYKRHFPSLRIAEGADVKRAFAECDFLLHGSGPSLVAAKSVVQWRKETSKPWGVLGITLQAAQLKDAEVREAFDAARFAYFRDSISLKVAQDAGLKCPVMEYAPDAAFSVKTKDDARATALLKQHGLEDGKFLCVIPRLRNSPYWVMKKHEPKDAPTAAEDKAKHAENERLKEHDHAMVRDALVAFLRKNVGMKVFLVPEDASHVWVGKEMFLDKLPDDVKPRVAWKDGYWLTDEAVAVYSRAFGLLSMDMHSPIMAIGNGVPAIVCRFKQQTSKGQMWADIGLKEWLFDLDVEQDGTRITEAVLAMAADPAAARAKAAKALAYVHERQRAAVGVLGKSLGI
ncbi:MAG TPA: polysaccharide pyruvyl transferase family protein [Humisphaera sp.]